MESQNLMPPRRRPPPSADDRLLLGIALGVVLAWGWLWVFVPSFSVSTAAGRIPASVLLLGGYVLIVLLRLALDSGVRALWVLRALLGIVIGLALLRLVIAVITPLPSYTMLWDDALMFARYVHNLRVHGALAWNVAQGAVYGPTEAVHLGWLWVLSWVVGLDAPHVALLLAGLAAGAVFLALVGVLVWRVTAPTGGQRWIVLAVIALGLAVQTPSLAAHFTTGMGTMLALAYVLAYLLLADVFHRVLTRAEAAPHAARWGMACAVWGGLAYFVRPEFAVFSVCIPGALVLAARRPQQRRTALSVALGTAAVLAVGIGAAWIGFGSPVPLSFYVKSNGEALYGAESVLYSLRTGIATDQLREYGYNNRLLLACIVLGLLSPRRWLRRMTPVGVGAAVAAGLLTLYYYAVVLQIMYMFQRFYYPTLPVLVAAAAAALSASLERLQAWGQAWTNRAQDSHARAARFPGRTLCAGGLAVLWIIVLTGIDYAALSREVAWAFAPRVLLRQPPPDEYNAMADWQWAGLAEMARLPGSPAASFVVASTEVGALAVANFGWTVVDLSGLNDRALAREGFSADVFLDETRPDLIYMPFIDYTVMVETMLAHPTFQHGYVLYDRAAIQANLSVAIRRDSPHYAAMAAILDRRTGAP